MQPIRASSLNQFNTCPRKYFEVEFDWKQEDLFFWTIQHFWARWYDIWPWMEYYTKHINHDIFLKDIWIRISDKLKKKVALLKKNAEHWYEEVPFLYKHWEIYLEWTADLLFKLKEMMTDTWKIEWFWNMLDYKTAAKDEFYTSWEVWKKYAQHYIYSFLAMEYLWISEIYFKYLPLVKNNSARIVDTYWMTITYEEAKEKSLQILDDYLFSRDTWIYEERVNSWCRWCPLKDKCQKYYDTNLVTKVVE